MGKFTMRDFIYNNVAVLVNEDDIDHFCRLCVDHNLRWRGGEDVRLFRPKPQLGKTFISIFHNRDDTKGLCYSPVGFVPVETPRIRFEDMQEYPQGEIDCCGLDAILMG